MAAPKAFRTIASVTLVIALTIALHVFGFLSHIETGLRNILTPLMTSAYHWQLSINGVAQEFTSVTDLERAYTDLLFHYEDAQVATARLARAELENAELREQLHFVTASTTIPTVGADVIGRDIESFGSSLIINRGSRDGVRVGLPVIAGTGSLVGRIQRVSETQSVVTLITDPQSRTIASLLNADKSVGLVAGGYGISVRMDFIPQNEAIAISDAVITSGLEPLVPKGLLIGTVEAIEREAYQPFQRAIITPRIPIDKVAVVSVMLVP